VGRLPRRPTRLLQSIADNDIENVVVLTGDIHAGGAADIRLPDADTTGDVVAHELVGTEHLVAGLRGHRRRDRPRAMGLAYANFADHGYVRCTVTPETWTTEFVIVDSIETETSDADRSMPPSRSRPGPPAFVRL
jgi:alkaline phosphatase D